MGPESYTNLKQEIAERMIVDPALLDQLRNEKRPLLSKFRSIQSRTATCTMKLDGMHVAIGPSF